MSVCSERVRALGATARRSSWHLKRGTYPMIIRERDPEYVAQSTRLLRQLHKLTQ